MHLHFFLCAWYTSFTPLLATDSISRQQPIHVAMDNLSAVPLPTILGLIPGNTPVDVSFDEALFNPETNMFIIRGFVIDQREKIEIPGVRVTIGTLDSTKTTGPIFLPRVSVLTDYQGQFKLTAKLTQTDVLMIIWLGYVEKVFRLKTLLENHE